MNISQAIRKAVGLIKDSDMSRSPETDAYVLLCYCLGQDKLWCHLNRTLPIDKATAERFFSMVMRRTSGEPVAYIRGKREFWSRDFAVNPHTLIPRPETELLVEHALYFIKSRDIDNPLILDLGTGSGIIGITLAAEVHDAAVIATDTDFTALKTARENAISHGVAHRVYLVQADWLTFCKVKADKKDSEKKPFMGFDIVACNPPYVSHKEESLLEKNVVDFEPHKALFSPDNGFFHIKDLLKKSPDILCENGMLLCEIGWTQGKKTRELTLETGMFKDIEIVKDYAGNDRLLKARLKEDLKD